MNPGLLDEDIRNMLERLGVERMADRLRFGQRRSHGFCPILELATDPLAVDGRWVPIPCEALDADLGNVAAEATVAFEQRCLHPRPRRCQCCGQTSGTRPDHEHFGLVNDVDAARRFEDSACHRSACSRVPATTSSV